MIKPKAFQLVAVALAAGMLIGAAADRAMSTADLRSLSSNEANHQFRSDLLSILRPMNKYQSGPRLVLGDAWTFTKAVATGFEPLCQRDMVVLTYGEIRRGGRYENWPVTPTGVSAERYYRFIAAPTREDMEATEKEGHFRSPLDSKCRAADKPIGGNEWAGWFKTYSAGDAMYAGFATLALQEWAARKGNRFSNCAVEANGIEDCDAYGRANLGLDKLNRMALCPAGGAGQICLELESGGVLFTIHARKKNDPIAADDIISVSALAQIVVT